MARYVTIDAKGLVVLADNPATKYRLDGAALVVTTSVSLALAEGANGRILPAFLIDGLNLITLRNRLANLIGWTDRTTSLVITDADLTAGTYGPMVNGRYRISLGNLRSTVPGVPAVKFLTTLAVTVYLSNLFGWGLNASQQTGMVYLGTNANLRFEETLFLSGKPPAGFANALPAHDIAGEKVANLEVVNCESHGTRGTLMADFNSNALSGLSTGGVRISKWGKYNVDGRQVDASGNWTTNHLVANYIQLQNCKSFPGNNSYCEDFILRNDPVYGAYFEDALSVYNSYCKSGETMYFRRGLVENALPYDPLFVASGGTTVWFGRDSNGNTIPYSGTGGLMGDQIGFTGLTETTVSQGFVMQSVTIVTTANYGAAIQAGHHQGLDNIIVVSAGVIRSNAPGGYSKLAWASQSGADGNGQEGGGLQSWNLTNSDASLYHDNFITNSDVGYYVFDKSGTYRKGYTPIWTPTTTGLTTANNIQRNVPASPLAGLAEADAARAARIQLFKAAGTVIGLTAATSFLDLKISTDAA